MSEGWRQTRLGWHKDMPGGWMYVYGDEGAWKLYIYESPSEQLGVADLGQEPSWLGKKLGVVELSVGVAPAVGVPRVSPEEAAMQLAERFISRIQAWACAKESR